MKSKNLNSHPILVTSIFSVLFLQFRSLFENSFSVYKVDLLILVTSYLVIQNEYESYKIEKKFLFGVPIYKNNGEGVLANKFITDLKKYNKNYIFKIKTVSFSNTKFLRNIFGSIADRFIFPSLGILYLWFVYIFKEHKKICYVNYLPLWNFLLFLFLPPKTIMGPITGGSKYLKKPYFNYYLRKIVLNFCILSVQILKLRQKNFYFLLIYSNINLIILKKLN